MPDEELEITFDEPEVPVMETPAAPPPPAAPAQQQYSQEEIDEFVRTRATQLGYAPQQQQAPAAPADLSWDEEIEQRVRQRLETEVTGKVTQQVQNAMTPVYTQQLIDQAKEKHLDDAELAEVRGLIKMMTPQQLADAALGNQGEFLASVAIGRANLAQRAKTPVSPVGMATTPASTPGKRSVSLNSDQKKRFDELVTAFGDSPAIKAQFLKEEGLA